MQNLAIAMCLLGANCFSGVCNKAVVVQGHVQAYPSVYYVPNVQQGTYKSESQQLYELLRKAVREELKESGVGNVNALSGSLVRTKCGTCHGAGKKNEDNFSIEGQWTAEKALHAQEAFLGLIDGVPNMAEKANVQGDGDAIKQLLIEFTQLPKEVQK